MTIRVLSPLYMTVISEQKITLPSTTSDGELAGQGTDYVTVHDAAAAHHHSSGVHSLLGQNKSGSTYSIFRSVLFFDTSLPSPSVTIKKAVLYIFGEFNYSDTDFYIHIVDGNDCHDPLQGSDYGALLNKTVSWGHIDSFGWAVYGFNDIEFNDTGIANINKSGMTQLALRSSRDISSTAPTGKEYVAYYNWDKGAPYQPKLEITYKG